MTRSAEALLAVAILISLVALVWTRLAHHVDLQLMPAGSRRRVQWLLSNARGMQIIAGVVIAAAVAVEFSAVV